jgi:Asp-tRNA(Asn)/Glu-tRNA(Gln) amidotransferase C subunit
MIEKEKIEHIANLAKLYIKEDEYKKYQTQCYDILSEINKFSPDVIENHISKTDAFKNSKRVKGDYIAVPKVVGGIK